MATKFVSKKPAMETEAKAEAARNDNVEISAESGYNARVIGPGGDITVVDILGVSKGDFWNGNYQTEDVTP